jgi:hypothetical protein
MTGAIEAISSAAGPFKPQLRLGFPFHRRTRPEDSPTFKVAY